METTTRMRTDNRNNSVVGVERVRTKCIYFIA